MKSDLVFIIDSISGGGTQNFLKNLLDLKFYERKYNITVLAFYDYKEKNIDFPTSIKIKFF